MTERSTPARAELLALTLDELRAVAAARGVASAAGVTREALVRTVLEAAGVNLPEREPGDRSPPVAPLHAPRSGSASGAPEGYSSSGVPWQHHPASENDPEAMAGLYLHQGHPERAAEIYRRLLGLRPDDAVLQRRLRECEDAILAAPDWTARPAPPAPRHRAPEGEPFGLLDFEELPDGYGVDECELIARDPHHLFAYWEITDGGVGSARGHLGAEAHGARLVLRLFITSSGDRGHVRETRDHELHAHRGRRYLPSPKPGVVVRAAVGLHTPGGLFTPIAHSSSIRVPYAEPAHSAAPQWVEVVPVPPGALELPPIEIRRGPETDGWVERGLPTPEGGDGEGTGENAAAGKGPSSPSRGRR